jgi:hypothetical protein
MILRRDVPITVGEEMCALEYTQYVPLNTPAAVHS